MMRTLRILAAISVGWSVGLFLLTAVAPSLYSSITYIYAASLGGDLAFAVGILALVPTASRRQVAWFALFALLLALLRLLPLLFYETPVTYFLTLTFFEAMIVRWALFVVLPALLSGVAFVYTLVVTDRTPATSGIPHARFDGQN